MDVAALVIAVLALVASGIATVYVKGQRDETRRQADVAEAADLRMQFGWRLEPVREGLFVLRNIGWASARNVIITSDLHVEFERAVSTVDLAPQQGVPIIALIVLKRTGLSIDITWTATYGQGGVEVVEDRRRTWTEPLPAAPARGQDYGRGEPL